jgi:hypothetical protein
MRAFWFCCALAAAGCSPPRQISDSGFGAFEVSLAAWSDGLAVAWHDTRDGNAEVYVRRLDAEGRFAGPELRVTTTSAQSFEADIAPLADAFAVAWYEKEQDGAMRAQLGVWQRDGTPVWRSPIAAGAGRSRNAIVRSLGDALFCAWIEADDDGESVWGGWWGRDGQPRAAPVRLGAAGETTWNLNAAIAPSGEAWVVFDAQADTRVEELFAATLGEGRATLVQLTADDGIRSKYPDVAFRPDGRGAITWFDERDANREVYLVAAPSDELRLPIERRARRVTTTPGASIGAYLAWNGGRIGLAWSDDSSGNYEVFFQSFDGDGQPAGPQRRLSDTPTSSMIPAIEPWRDGFALAWDEVIAAPKEDTRAEVVFTTVRP